MYRQTEAIADDQRMPINYRKSKVFSTISTRLLTGYLRPEPESNRRIRICSPLRHHSAIGPQAQNCVERAPLAFPFRNRSEEHTSELQSLMLISYAVFCFKKNTQSRTHISNMTQYTER